MFLLCLRKEKFRLGDVVLGAHTSRLCVSLASKPAGDTYETVPHVLQKRHPGYQFSFPVMKRSISATYMPKTLSCNAATLLTPVELENSDIISGIYLGRGCCVG